MGFNKKIVDFNGSFEALKENKLEEYYGKNDMLLFQDNQSSDIHELYTQGKTNEEIFIIIKKRWRKTDEIY